MNLEKIQRKGISPIIATLLLILIAIAAGVIVYAYVVGFIGNSTSNTGNNTSVISIDNGCVSHASTCSSKSFTVVIRNVGSTTIGTNSSNTGACLGTVCVSAALYFVDTTAGTTPTLNGWSCIATSGTGVSPGSTYTCSGTLASAPSAGDIITIKVVNPDGGATTTSVKAI